MKEGLTKGKALAKDVAGKAVQMGLEKLGVPEGKPLEIPCFKFCILAPSVRAAPQLLTLCARQGGCHAPSPSLPSCPRPTPD